MYISEANITLQISYITSVTSVTSQVIFDTHHRIYCQIYFALLSAKKGKLIQDIMYCVNICCVYA